MAQEGARPGRFSPRNYGTTEWCYIPIQTWNGSNREIRVVWGMTLQPSSKIGSSRNWRSAPFDFHGQWAMPKASGLAPLFPSKPVFICPTFSMIYVLTRKTITSFETFWFSLVHVRISKSNWILPARGIAHHYRYRVSGQKERN